MDWLREAFCGEEKVVGTLAPLFWGWLPASALCVQCKVMFIYCSINPSDYFHPGLYDSFTNRFNFHVRPSWLGKALSVAWCGGDLWWEGFGGAEAGVNKSHFVEGEHCEKWRAKSEEDLKVKQSAQWWLLFKRCHKIEVTSTGLREAFSGVSLWWQKHWRHCAEGASTCLCSLLPVQGDVYSLFYQLFRLFFTHDCWTVF